MNTRPRMHSHRKGLRLRTLVGAMLLADPARHALADPLDDVVEFDAAMLGVAYQDTDLSRFAHGNPLERGLQDVAISVNGIAVARRRVRFDVPDGRAKVEPCFDRELLDIAGVRPELVADIEATPAQCRALDVALPGARYQYDGGDYTLGLSIPQADLDFMARGETDPSTWERGINAARLNYGVSAFHAETGAPEPYRSASAHLDAGANLGAWRFRHRSTHQWTNDGRTSQVLSAYAQTDVPAHRAQATFGDFQTTGALFDSIALRGVEFESDERMWPDSRRGYAPEVRGIAHGNAVVTIRQNGNIIHEVNVPAGPFVIRDLYPTGYGGALDVTVTEADGRQEVFIVPYASVPQLLRPGSERFSIAIGQWQGYGAGERPLVMQATGQRGFNNLLTGYAGFQAADDHAALLVGAAVNTRIGAFALDANNAWAQPGERAMSGQTWRLSYSHFLPSTETSVLVAAHRHSTRDYWSLADQIAYRAQRAGLSDAGYARSRNQFEMQVNQPVGRGSLHASASLRDFWDRASPERYAQVSYAFPIGPLGLSLATRWRENDMGRSREAWLNLTLPLSITPRSSHRVSATAGHANDRGTYGNASLTGSGGPDQRLSYGLTLGREGDEATTRTSANVGYEGGKGRLAVMASQADGQRQWSGSADGGLLWHSGGLTFGPTMTDTVGLVHAVDAQGARVPGAPGVRVDRRGYALVPSLAPYRVNLVDVDPRGIGHDVRFDSTMMQVVPRAGAIALVPFATSRETSWMLRAQREDGEHVPFGAEVRDANGAVLGTVGQGGTAFLSGEPAEGALRVEWGDAEHERCHVEDGLPSATQTAAFLPHVEAPCVAPQRGG